MTRCKSCNGIIGIDCFNPVECQWITNQMQSDIDYQRGYLDAQRQVPEQRAWIETELAMPEYNVGVLVFIPDEDNHVTSGMWDVSDKWVLLDEYRVPEKDVTHWMPLPEPPININQ